MVTTILFVCPSNRAISQMAASYVMARLTEAGRKEDFLVNAAGVRVNLQDAMSAGARKVLAELGMEPLFIGVHRIGLKDIREADLIVCSSDEIVKQLTHDFRSAVGKTIHLMSLADGRRDVFEPRANLEACRNCFLMMRPALDKLVERIL